MRALFGAFLLLAGLCVAAPAQTPSPKEFTAQFVRALQAAMPSAKIRIVRDLQLDVERPDGSAATVSLANNYKDFTTDPKWFDAVIKAYATALAKPLNAKLATGVDMTRIVPVIKDRSWLAELQGRFKQKGASQPLFEDFAGELVVVYAEDTDKATRYLNSSEIEGFEPGRLRALAVENLMRLMPRIEMRQLAEGAYMITSHADYGASLILADSIWSGDQVKVNGDIVVAVPAKDVILATGSRDRKNLKSIRQLTHDLAKGNGGLIETLFVYRKGRFVKFGRD
jgi:uncharacterized protein YtpQ (UPF0354 family)